MKSVPLAAREYADDAAILARASVFADQLRTRRSVRDFDPRPVARPIIEACLRAAGSAPSGANQQH